MPKDGHDAQAQAGGVAAHQVGGLEQQLGFYHAQLVQQLSSQPGSVGGRRGREDGQISSQTPSGPTWGGRARGAGWRNGCVWGEPRGGEQEARHPSHQGKVQTAPILKFGPSTWEWLSRTSRQKKRSLRSLPAAAFCLCPSVLGDSEGLWVSISAQRWASNRTSQPISARDKLSFSPEQAQGGTLALAKGVGVGSPVLPTHLDGKVDEPADVERILHQVEDELDVLHQRQVVGHP